MSRFTLPLASAILVAAAGAGLASPLAQQSESLSDAAKKDVELARRELAKVSGTQASEIELESVEAVEWRDRSIGCPQKGMTYSPVIIPGHVVRLRAGERSYLVNVGGDRAVVCRRAPDQGKPSTAGREAPLLDRIYEARRDLASKLDAEERAIRVLSTEPAKWPDASLGCPQAGETYAQVETHGYVITLAIGGKSYRYHTDLERLMACPASQP